MIITSVVLCLPPEDQGNLNVDLTCAIIYPSSGFEVLQPRRVGVVVCPAIDPCGLTWTYVHPIQPIYMVEYFSVKFILHYTSNYIKFYTKPLQHYRCKTHTRIRIFLSGPDQWSHARISLKFQPDPTSKLCLRRTPSILDVTTHNSIHSYRKPDQCRVPWPKVIVSNHEPGSPWVIIPNARESLY